MPKFGLNLAMVKNRHIICLILSFIFIFSVAGPSSVFSQSISYIEPPTPPPDSTTSNNYVEVNATVTGIGLTSFIDWNYSLIAWYRFEALFDSNDYSSYNNDASCSIITCPLYMPFFGPFGGTGIFDGSSFYLDLSSHKNDPEFNTSVGAVELWFSPNSDSHYSQLFNFRNDSYRNYIFIREFREDKIMFEGEIANTIEFQFSTPSNSISADVWYHLVFQQTGEGFEVYLNGQPQTISGVGMDSTMWFTDTFPANSDITVGHWGGWSDTNFYVKRCYFDGFLDEFRIWKRPLSAAEVKASYNANLNRLGANFTDLADGRYDYTAYVQDSAGNLDSDTRTVYVDSTSPPPPSGPLDIDFVDPTIDDNDYSPGDYAYVNTTVTGSGDLTAFLDWDNSLVGWWRFESNGDYTDYSTYTNDGSCTNCPTYTSGGRFGGAMTFDGSNDYINFGADSALDMGTEMTIGAWVYYTGGETRKTIATRWFSYFFEIYSDKLDVYLYGTTTEGWHSSDSTVPMNSWQYVAFTYDGSNINFYINGNKDTNQPVASGSITNTGADFYIGDLDYHASRAFGGRIDDVRIWNRALTEDEIKASYNAGLYRLENNFTGLADGSYTYTAYVQDSSGDLDSETRTVYIDSSYSPPTPTESLEIAFVDPTKISGYSPPSNYAYVNTSINGSGDLTALINWNRSLVGWWRFNDASDFTDYSSYSNPCINVGTAYDTDGKFGGSRYLDGLGRYVNCGDTDSLSLTGPLTIESWVKFDSFTGTDGWLRTIVSKGHEMGNSAYWLGYGNEGGVMKCYFEIGNGTKRIELYQADPDPLDTGSWHYIAGVYDGYEVRFYKDGQEAFSSPTDIRFVETSGYDFMIGRYSYSNFYSFNGTIDEVRVWNRPLSDDEIKASYNAGLYRLENNFTNLDTGTYNYVAYVQNSSGHIAQTDTRTIIIGSAPSSYIYRINGTVTNTSGSLLSGVLVTATLGIDSYQDTTDSAGYYEILGLGPSDPSSYGLTADITDYIPGIGSVIISSANVTVDFVLDRTTNTIQGTVENPDLLPLDGVHVVATDGINTYENYTNAAGEYELHDVLSSTYDITVTKSGYITTSQNNILVSTTVTVNFIMPRNIAYAASRFAEVYINPDYPGVKLSFFLGSIGHIPVLLRNPTEENIVIPLHVGSDYASFRNLLRLNTGERRYNDLNVSLMPHEDRYVMIDVIAGKTGSFNIVIGPDDNPLNAYDSVDATVVDRDRGIFSRTPGLAVISVLIVLVIAVLIYYRSSGSKSGSKHSRRVQGHKRK